MATEALDANESELSRDPRERRERLDAKLRNDRVDEDDARDVRELDTCIGLAADGHKTARHGVRSKGPCMPLIGLQKATVLNQLVNQAAPHRGLSLMYSPPVVHSVSKGAVWSLEYRQNQAT